MQIHPGGNIRRILSILLPAAVIFGIAVSAGGCAEKKSTSIAPGAVTLETKNPLTDSPSAAAAGKSLYAANCAMCHGENGDGEGVASDSLAAKPTDLTSGKILADPDGLIFLAIKEGKMTDGKMTMPPIKRLTDEQIWQIVAYLRSIGK